MTKHEDAQVVASVGSPLEPTVKPQTALHELMRPALWAAEAKVWGAVAWQVDGRLVTMSDSRLIHESEETFVLVPIDALRKALDA